jgi:hypothetical protein
VTVTRKLKQKMTSLGEIAFIRDNIKNAPVKSIKALHMFIFESEGDRKNRSRLRGFKGFDFDENSKEFETKLEYQTRIRLCK